MNMSSIAEKVKAIVFSSTHGRVDPSSLQEDTDLIVDVGIDSIEALEILLRVEEEFGIQIEEENLNRNLLRTVNQLARYIEGRLK